MDDEFKWSLIVPFIVILGIYILSAFGILLLLFIGQRTSLFNDIMTLIFLCRKTIWLILTFTFDDVVLIWKTEA